MERLLDYFTPEKYTLDLSIDKEAKTISGTVDITGEAKQETIKFHAVGLEVENVKINGKKHEFKYENGLMSVFKAPLGPITIKVGYHGTLNENMQGAYLSTYEHQGKTEVIVATQFESHYAREAFPCIDEPAAKAVFELTLTTPDNGDIVLANTPVKSQKANSGRITTVFEPTPRMSTYLLAWVVGRFQSSTTTNSHGTKITTYCSLSQSLDSVDFANEIAAKSLEFYDDNFKVPYPLEKLDQVALPDFEAGAMENWGLVTYRESMLLAGKTATTDTKKSVALTVAHELSHQWFGDLVTMQWWDDLWLNESFASVMEYYAVDHIHPEYQIFEGFFTGDCFSALIRDAYTDVQSVHQEVHDPAEIATLFDGAIVYSKGAHLMLMLIRLMGWEQFCRGVSEYFKKHKYANTIGDDLWASLRPYAEFDPKKLMHAFIDQPGYPVFTKDSNNYSQRRFLLDSAKMPESSWPVPEVTEDMSGHYIINLSQEDFEARLRDFDSLGLEEKLRLLIDRSLLARTELVSSASLIPLVRKFESESSAAVWEIVAIIIGQLKVFFEPDSPEEERFKQFISGLVSTKLSEIGLTTRDQDDENTLRLRAILLGLDYYAKTEANLRQLAELYSSDYVSLDPEIRDTILDAKIYLDPSILDEYLSAYQQIADPEIKADLRNAMTLSQDAKNIRQMVSLLNQPEIIKPQDQLFLFVRLFRNSKARESTFGWLIENWDYVRRTMGDKSLDAYPRYTANIIRTQSEYNKWQEFFKPMQNNPALSRAIEIGNKEIKSRLNLIQSDSNAVIEALAQLP